MSKSKTPAPRAPQAAPKSTQPPATFAARLRALRESAGLSQQQLADAAGVHRQQVLRYEAGTFAPPWDVACRLADALQVSVQAFR